MNSVIKYNNPKATVCANQTCVTVYGKAAEFVTAVVVISVSIVALIYLLKALK